MAQTSRPCDGCGTDVPRMKPTGSIPPYCSDECKPRCSVEDCDEAVKCRGWCVFHYTRWKLAGDPLAPLERSKNVGLCSIDGCDEPMRKRGWCASHYAQWKRTGTTPQPFKFKWGQAEPRHAAVTTRGPRATAGTPCRVCDTPSTRPSWYCSDACYALWRHHKGKVPRFVECVGCGAQVDLLERGKGGQRRKASTKFCAPCRRDYNKYKMSARELAQRDGSDCRICGDPVDMDLRRYDDGGIWCASVDHKIPRALGGTHDPENLQLAHLYCNQVKSDRLGFSLA